MLRKTKIIATISNMNCEPDFIKILYEAGMNVVRLNTAHMNHEDALLVVNNVRSVSDRIAILLDTKGPEIRTCRAEKHLEVDHGDYVRFKGAPDEVSKDDIICVTHSNFVKDIPINSTILIDDGSIALTVKEKDDEYLKCFVENPGVIIERKSINIPSVHVTLPAISQKDESFINFAAEHNIDFIAHSFVRNKSDVIAVQKILDETNSKVKIIAKIENKEGVDNIEEILDYAFGIMIARGDLAVEIPAQKIPLIQKKIINICMEKRKPVIVATQMLHSMINSPRPTRAEVSDIANACLDHTDALMLSGETASGLYPVESVRTMAKIAKEVESDRSTFYNAPYIKENKVTSYLAKAAVKASIRLQTKLIVADTVTGKTIRSIATYRGDNYVYVVSYNKRVTRELALSYGINAHYYPMEEDSSVPIRKAILKLLNEGKLEVDDLITVLAGHFGIKQGASYIEISKVGNMIEKRY